MGGVRSSGWASLLALASVAALSCGRTAKNGAESTPNPAQGGTPSLIEPEPDAPQCAREIAGIDGRHCGLYKDHTVWCFGGELAPAPANYVPSSEPLQVKDAYGENRLVLSHRHDCLVDGRGQIWCWGDNESGQIDDTGKSPLAPTQVSLVPPMFASLNDLGLSDTQTCAVNPESHVYCRGTDASGARQSSIQVFVAGAPDTTMPGDGSNLVLDELGRAFSISTWEKPEVLPYFGRDNARIFGGAPTCALKRWGSLWCTDYRTDVTDLPLRAIVPLGEDVVDAGVGDLFMCALTKQGRVWCEGFNLLGQTATGTNSTFEKGHFVAGLENVRVLAVNHASACALTADGNVSCWGAYAKDRQTNVPTLVSGCDDPMFALPLPATLSPRSKPSLADRLAEASRARGQGTCACVPPDDPTLESCIDAESFAPNATCLAALLPQDAARWQCRGDNFWAQAKCFLANGCPLSTEGCPLSSECPDSMSQGIEQYCRRPWCGNDIDAPLLKTQICDGVADCKDGSDERNCAPNAFNFDCGSTTIPIAQVCDHVRQCADGSDEDWCP